jgi:hypothetical protein
MKTPTQIYSKLKGSDEALAAEISKRVGFALPPECVPRCRQCSATPASCRCSRRRTAMTRADAVLSVADCVGAHCRSGHSRATCAGCHR